MHASAQLLIICTCIIIWWDMHTKVHAHAGSITINLIRRLFFVIVQCLTHDSYSDLIVRLTKEKGKKYKQLRTKLIHL